MTDWQRPDVEAPLIVWEYVEAVERIADKREAERQQAIDALRRAEQDLGKALGVSGSVSPWLRDTQGRIHAALLKLGWKP